MQSTSINLAKNYNDFVLYLQHLSDALKKQETMAEPQESGSGSVEEEIGESQQ
jgi:hypothetical protein